MICHLLEPIALVKLDCWGFCIDNQANPTHLTGNACDAVNGIKKHERPDTFALLVMRVRFQFIGF